MSRVSEFRFDPTSAEYGVIGAGALSKSLIGQLPAQPRQIGSRRGRVIPCGQPDDELSACRIRGAKCR